MTAPPLPDDEPLRLPAAPTPPPPVAFPLLSALAPVLGAALLWVVTGSVLTLWFAALGPVMAVASALDGRRGSRRSLRKRRREYEAAIALASDTVRRRHDREREDRWAIHPDVARHLSRLDGIWRPAPARSAGLVVGSGTVRSELRVEGGDGGGPAAGPVGETASLRTGARLLAGAPIVAPLDAGFAVVGPAAVAEAVVRGLVLQACMNLTPDQLRVAGPVEAWAEALPHRQGTGERVVRMASADSSSVRPGRHPDAMTEVTMIAIEPDAPVPSQCGVVLTLKSPVQAQFVLGGAAQSVVVQPVSVEQAEAAASMLAERWVASGAPRCETPPLDELLRSVPGPGAARLPAVLGVAGTAPAIVDLVADGPHAVVIGVTGSGKSELLITWVASLAATHTPQQVAFLLVDFKGGRSFDALRQLPHVTGVLTDLDEAAALRAIDSLRAEMLHRERVLARLGARDVAEADGALARLVVVVDEYAALVAAHPALHDLFGDIAARGRALGVHLILASQRAAGVFRDAVLANAPLRLALRVTDRGDSQAVLGTDDAALLSGRPEDRGGGLVRGPADDRPRPFRIVRCPPVDLPALVDLTAVSARRPWLPPLPPRVELSEVVVAGEVVIGIADEPDRQRQRAFTLSPEEPGLVVLGAAGSGRSTVLRTLARQCVSVVPIPAEPEHGWDAIGTAERAAPGTLIVVDDVDLLLSRLTAEHAVAARDRLEQLAREARARGIRIALSAQRPTAAVSRIVDALPRRFLLSHATRADYAAAGGEPSHHARLPAGRGRIDGLLVQGAWTPEAPSVAAVTPRVGVWAPARHPVAFIAPDSPQTRRVLDVWAAHGSTVTPVEHGDDVAVAGRVVWGTPDVWLAQWRALAQARAHAHLVVDAACAGHYRALTGDTALPPYVAPHVRRAWLRTADGETTRIRLPG